MRRRDPQTSDVRVLRHRAVEMASGVEPWQFWIDSRSRNTSSSSRLAASSVNFMCAIEINKFWRRLAAGVANMQRVPYPWCGPPRPQLRYRSPALPPDDAEYDGALVPILGPICQVAHSVVEDEFF